MSDPLRQLADEGVAIWLDDMSRQRPVSGNLKALVRDKHRGRRDDQSDPLPEGDHDQRRLRRAAPRLAALDVPAAQAVLLITTHDVRSVCDLLRPVYEVTEGRDGRVSLEVDPRLAHDTDAPWPRRHDRPLRPPPAAADGPGRHGGHSRDAGGDLRDRPARQREGQPRLSGAAGPVALVVAKLYVFAFGMSWGPVVWVMLGEKFPNRIRAAALGVARPRRGSPTG
jgi:hypothetical protein